MAKNRTKINHEYNLQTYDRIEITVLKGQKQVIQDYVDKNNLKSVNNFIKSCIYEKMGVPEPSVKEINKTER